jgi:uncharacterized C2H2 Zn-finger protein
MGEIMPKCPKCGAEINELLYYAYELNHAHFYVNENTGRAEFHNWDTIPDTKGDPDFECPECEEVLFHSQEEAEKFLRGEPIKVEQ